MADVFRRLDRLAAAGDHEAVIALASRALDETGADEAGDLWRYLAWAHFEADDFVSSLAAARSAGHPLAEAKAHFHLWRFDDAEEALVRGEAAYGAHGDDAAEVAWYRGLLCEFSGRDPGEHYRAAASRAPDLFRPPARLIDEEVDRVVVEAMGQLPAAVARAIEDAVVTVVPLPTRHPDVDPLTLGLYMGADHMQRSLEGPPEMPPRIEIYRRNIERIAEDREHAIDELRITLLHEIAHHLGFDEPGVEHLGLE